MGRPDFHPLDPLSGSLSRFLRLRPHMGKGQVTGHGDPSQRHPFAVLSEIMAKAAGKPPPEPATPGDFEATCFVPAAGSALILLRGSDGHPLSQNFGTGLSVVGECEEGQFELHCPRYYVLQTSENEEGPGWAIARPVNAPTTIRYGDARDETIATVHALINKYDFVYGNVEPDDEGAFALANWHTLRVEAESRIVEFAHIPDRDELHLLVRTRLLFSASFASFKFDAWDGATEEDLVQFSHAVASLCSYAVGQHTGIPILTFRSASGKAVKRLLFDAVESDFRHGGILDGRNLLDGATTLFKQCFDEHRRMQAAASRWRRLPFMCACIEDPPYLEQKFASLMMALEYFLKLTLREDGHVAEDKLAKMALDNLVGAARGHLRWNIPGHYTPKGLFPQLRNAVMHGGELPTKDAAEFRHAFAKWKLFLLRRVLMRLGYRGQVVSPEKRCSSLSGVDDFTELHNSFE